MICCDKLNIAYHPHFLTVSESNQYFNQLINSICWQQESYKMFGKSVLAPRLVAWHGDEDAIYQYSGVKHQPSPWNEPLLQLKHKVEVLIRHPFNSVLLNLYRDGQDSMGWHTDNERELSDKPIIASITLGAERKFLLRNNQTKQRTQLTLEQGSVLIMQGDTQNHYKHSIPKTNAIIGPRINLTFRLIKF
ncbi:alpha-ketoglutarate-dependent dioxygenase AlkB [Legionella sp. W05-934-2]|uniref:alpha-ketoglutarate-dependent dioxygenase AlkB family protein n=1 Tax=Legionella sp. W05-934-2 TaxID=1198649 RepID=UPI0034637EA1